jgi:hypothetical protein
MIQTIDLPRAGQWKLNPMKSGVYKRFVPVSDDG